MLGDLFPITVRVFAFIIYFMTECIGVEPMTLRSWIWRSTNWANFPKVIYSPLCALTVVSYPFEVQNPTRRIRFGLPNLLCDISRLLRNVNVPFVFNNDWLPLHWWCSNYQSTTFSFWFHWFSMIYSWVLLHLNSPTGSVLILSKGTVNLQLSPYLPCWLWQPI